MATITTDIQPGGTRPINPANLTTPTLLEQYARQNGYGGPLFNSHQWCYIMNKMFPNFTCTGGEIFTPDATQPDGWLVQKTATDFLNQLRAYYEPNTVNPNIANQPGGGTVITGGGGGGTAGGGGGVPSPTMATITGGGGGINLNWILLGAAILIIAIYAWREYSK
jgi:hypothetical protein